MTGVLWLVLAAAAAAAGEPRRMWSDGVEYDVDSLLHVSEEASPAEDVVTRLRATLRVAPLWTQGDEALLGFEVPEVWSETRGPQPRAEFQPRKGPWSELSGASWAAMWVAGTIQEFHSDSSLEIDFLNYQRAITSLFQFQQQDGEFNETDVSGSCTVLYESESADVIGKFKRDCVWEGGSDSALQWRRVGRVQLEGGALREAVADEVCTLAGAEGLRARGTLRLRRRGPAPAPAPAASAAAALQPLRLAALPLPLQRDRAVPDPLQQLDPPLSAEEAVRQHAAVLQAAEAAGAGGDEGAARAALAVLAALRGGGAGAAAALRGAAPALWRLAGAAGGAAHAAAAPHLREPSARALAYLDGFALALHPQEAAVRDVFELSSRARGGDEGAGEGAGEALRAAAARAAAGAGGRAAAALRRELQAAVSGRLARCGPDACAAEQLRALRALAGAEDAADAGEAAALAALEARGEDAALAAAAALRGRRLAARSLLRPLAAALSGRPLPARAAALRLALHRALRFSPPFYEIPRRLAEGLRGRGDGELRRVLWGSLQEEAGAGGAAAAAAAALPALLPTALRNWNTLANAGTSLVLERETGWSVAGWDGVLNTVQVAQGGVLRRGGVTLRARGAGGAAGRELLDVQLWTRGLEAWAGGDAQPGEEPAAGVQLAAGGAALPDLPLFSSQAELLGALWAGAGSEDTPVLRAFLPLLQVEAAAPLAAGVLLRARAHAGVALALDAAASASLWSRTAAARLQLRVAGAARASLAASARGSTAAAALNATAAAELRASADLDFYGPVALCVRADVAPLRSERRAALLAAAGGPGARHELRRRRSAAGRGGGPRSLALGRDNDRACRALGAADQ